MAPRKVATHATGHELAALSFIVACDAMALTGWKIHAGAAVVAKYRELAVELRGVFHRRFYNPAAGTYGENRAVLQSLTVAPLALGDTVLEAIYAPIVAGLVNNTRSYLPGGPHLTVGSVGASAEGALARRQLRARYAGRDVKHLPGLGVLAFTGRNNVLGGLERRRGRHPPSDAHPQPHFPVVASASGYTAQWVGSRRSPTVTSVCSSSHTCCRPPTSRPARPRPTSRW